MSLAPLLDGLERRLRGEDVALNLEASTTLLHLANVFQLSEFEASLIALCAAAEFRPEFHDFFREKQGPERGYPTFSLAMSVLPNPNWVALAPDSALRRWRLIEVAGGLTLTQSPLKIDEWVLHLLAGTEATDERLLQELIPLEAERPMTLDQADLVQRVARAWEQGYELIQLYGPDAVGKAAVVRGACEAYSWSAMRARQPADIPAFCVLWERHAAVLGSVLVAEEEDFEGAKQLLERVRGPRVLFTRDRSTVKAPNSLALEVNPPTAQEQKKLWVSALGEHAPQYQNSLDRLVGHFTLSPESIRNAAGEALANGEEHSVWHAARKHARLRLEELAARTEPTATWDDLILPTAQTDTLRQICAHVRQRLRVYDDWGFGSRGARGLGISALFSGPSGTGKTLAAEVVANEMGLDLFRIDLASVVSKYIGETEKNLRRIFDAAESGGAVLLFDEADALFGKRSEVKDSHDRYANIEVSYLLQRIEAFRGLAILTTNLKSSFDTAFLRRLRFVVEFPFPDAEQRQRIWQRAFTDQTPTEGLESERLAQMSLSGGSIRNVALNAAFQAADEGVPVGMKHILNSARTEYQKLERPMTESETRGWA